MSLKLAVIDFGSTYTEYIHRTLKKLQFPFEKFEVTKEKPEGSEIFEKIKTSSWLGIILSGSKDNLYNPNARQLPKEFLGYIIQYRIPTLAICYGHQMLVHLTVDGEIMLNPLGLEKGRFQFTQTQSGFPLFKDLPEKFKVDMHHFDIIRHLPESFKNFGQTKKTQYGAIQMSQNGEDLSIFGVQFHPEKSRRKIKYAIFKNFYDLCVQKEQ